MSWRPLSSLAPALLGAFGLFVACFDSDEKPVPLTPPSATTGAVPPSTSSSSSGLGSTSTGTPEVTCRDAIDCVVGCAGELQTSKLPEPDLTCFLECEEGLTVGEALHLFRLTECVTNKCIEQGVCDVLVPTDTTSGGSSSSGGDMSSSSGGSSSSGSSTGGSSTGGSSTGGSSTGGSSSSGSSTGGSSSSSDDGPAVPANPCLDCILANMLDPAPQGCRDLADECV